MKFLFCLLLGILPLTLNAAPATPSIPARAWVLIDAASGQELAAKDADVQLEPASLTKLMTAYLIFTDIDKGILALDRSLAVPEAAAKSDGARMFLRPGQQVKVDDLLQGMLVQSAADAVLTLVDATAGSEAKFVQRMNLEAARLGMTRTRLTNARGLSQPGHVTTAHDLAVLARALQRGFPGRQAYFSQKEFSYQGVTFYNGNRLLWLDASVDGLKTGRTAQAGYCLAASARRGDQRRIAVLLGAGSDDARFQGGLKLLNHGFENFDSVLLYRAGQPVKLANLYRGERNTVSLGFLQDFYLLMPKGSADRVKADIVTRQPMVAPIRKGQVLGSLRLTLDGQLLGEYPLLAQHDVGVAGIFGRGLDSIKLLFAK
jgi:D-alanyl-D-alanine carboxypeptidase/D-alanyl-D-alanine carboxypeptidase (penicillin-binding protein 5/6)